MNRRTFAQTLAAAAVAAAAPPLSATAAITATKTPSFGFSVMLWTVFGDLPFEARLEKVAEAGYNQIELIGEYEKWSPEDFTRFNAARKRLGISFDTTAGLHHGMSDPAESEVFLAQLRKDLVPMEKLEIPAIIVLASSIIPGLAREVQHNAAIETLKRAAAVVEGRQISGQPVRLLLECVDPVENPKYFLPKASEALEIIQAVNHPQVQFLYDIYHEQIAEGYLIDKLDKHIDKIGLIHIADVPGRNEPGTGEINYVNIYRKLAQLNYRHNIAMEFYPSGDPVATLRAAKDLACRSAQL
jgi:hydroxypyruvate isomerase